MNKFSKYGKKVDKVVEGHMKIIIEEVKKELNDIISILVIGGLGRGEGSFLIKDKKIFPLNDYDIYLVTEKKVDFDLLKKISLDATKRILKDSKFSFSESSSLMEFYVDLRNLTIIELRNVEPLLKYYEIRESARVIYGRDVRKEMPAFNIEAIPLEEGFRFLMNRMSLLIESFDITNLNSRDTKKTILYYTGKNYLSCAEALLLLNKRFICSYAGRAKLLEESYKKDFPELSSMVPGLPEKVNLFTKYKLKPSENFFKGNVLDFWFTARDDMLKVANFYISKAFNIKNEKEFYKKIEELSHYFLRAYLKIFIRQKFKLSLPNFLLSLLLPFAKFYFNWLYYKRNLMLNKKRNFSVLFSLKDINLRIYSLCPLVLLSLGKDLLIDRIYLEKAEKKITKLGFFGNIKNWEELRRKYSDLFRIYQFLKS